MRLVFTSATPQSLPYIINATLSDLNFCIVIGHHKPQNVGYSKRLIIIDFMGHQQHPTDLDVILELTLK